jgi:pimeloyl-ACP methyl ester carboxylesterase
VAVTAFDDDDVPRHDVPRDGRSGFVVIEGRQVHYLEWGRSDAPPVLCLHGGGQTAYMYEELGAHLAPRFHVLAPDLPNHGDSGNLDGAMGPAGIAATIPPLLDHFGLDRIDLVGASLGGLSGLVLAAERPELITSISLIDVGHQLEPEGVRKIVDFMSAHESFASLEDAAAEISEYLPQRKNVRPESLSRNLRQRADGRWVWKHSFGRRFRSVEPSEHPADNLDAFMADVSQSVGRVTCPVLVLRGEQSDVLSDAGAQAIVDALPDARLAVVERAGHLAAGDNPHSTVNLIADFLDEGEGRG